MNDKPQIKLSETVVLIDAAFLNFVITDMKGYFEETLRRSLQDIDLSIFFIERNDNHPFHISRISNDRQ